MRVVPAARRRPSSSCTAAPATPRSSTSTTASGPASLDVPDVPGLPPRGRPTPAPRRTITDDAYRYLPTLGEVDLHLINEGRHEQLWKVLGAHVHTTRADRPGHRHVVRGVGAARQGVRLKGDFNSWDGREHPMRQLGVSGVWELFVPGVGSGTRYKFVVLGADGQWREKADPMAFHTEVPPATSSVVFESTYTWGDDAWMTRARGRRRRTSGRCRSTRCTSARGGAAGPTRELADELVAYVVETGFTHVEFLPVMEHPFGGSWGYQVTSYFAPTARFGDPDGLRLPGRPAAPGRHRRDRRLGARALPQGRLRAGPLRRHPALRGPEPAPRRAPGLGHLRLQLRPHARSATSWSPTRSYWLEEFHIDGLRVDAVASMLYLDYSREDGRVDARTCTAAARTSRRWRSCRR